MLSQRQTILRLATIAAILGAVVLVFAWVAGFLSPARISGGKIADVLQAANGKVYPGSRRAHAKGLCVSGRFEANGAGVALSQAALFPRGSVPVIGRFSTGGGNPLATDGRNVFHALGLRFALPGGEEWRMAIDHTPIFVVSNPADFVALQQASVPDPKTGKPDPARVKAFAASHPETQAFMDYMKTAPLPSSFANGTYYSINAFRFSGGEGGEHLVRWRFVPEAPFAALDKAKLDALPKNALFDEARARIAKGRVSPGRTALAELVERSFADSWIVRALGAAFEMKDQLKARGYRWDVDRKVWWLEVVDRTPEEWWLTANVYAAAARPKALGPEWVRITNRERWGD